MPLDTSPAVKALAHPIRRDIITAIANGNASPSEIAPIIAEPLGVVSYHTRMLRDYGVIEVDRTEPRRGALQHFYRFTRNAVSEFEQVRALADSAIQSAGGDIS